MLGGPLTTTGIEVSEAIAGRFGDQALAAVQRAVWRLTQRVRDRARQLCPVDTGALRSSIYASGPGTPMQQTSGYFRAIQAAARRNPRRLYLDSEYVKSPRTQARTQEFLEGLAFLDPEDAHDQLPFSAVVVGGRAHFFCYVGAAAFYAGFVEYGTQGRRAQSAQPFMRPALDWGAAQMVDVIRAAIAEGASNARKV